MRELSEARAVPEVKEPIATVDMEGTRRERSDASTVKDTVISQQIALKGEVSEISKLIAQGVLENSKSPRCVSPLHVVAQGDVGVARARNLMRTVGRAQAEGLPDAEKFEKSKEPRILELKESMSSSTSPGQGFSEELEGSKKDFLLQMASKLGAKWSSELEELSTVHNEAKAMSTAKTYKAANTQRKKWLIENDLKSSEESLLLYLAHRARTASSSSLSIIASAYRTANDSISAICGTFVTDLIKKARRLEVDQKQSKKDEISIDDVEKIIQMAISTDDSSTDRDALIAYFSFNFMLRASELANLTWEDIEISGGTIRLQVSRAKNDQQALGRTSYAAYHPGSGADIVLSRSKTGRNRQVHHVITNLDRSKHLTAPSISALASKMLRRIGKINATHHDFRRGGANHLQNLGFSFDEIRLRGRWRSAQGLTRYLKDSPVAQGIQQTDPHHLPEPKRTGIGTSNLTPDLQTIIQSHKLQN